MVPAEREQPEGGPLQQGAVLLLQRLFHRAPVLALLGQRLPVCLSRLFFDIYYNEEQQWRRPPVMRVPAGSRSAHSPIACEPSARALHEVVVGQDEVIDQLLVCALTGSHALLVGVPGLAKTLMVKALAAAFRWKYGRIQFTPDLMPADVTGYELLGRGENGQGPTMAFRRGPVFANLVLADEINRAAPKTQSALLEAMAERHVTVGGKTYPLEEPFLVAATQNPIEQEGTYPLPEAQLDRFMMEIRIGYPTPEQEEEIVLRTTAGMPDLPEASLDREEFLELRDLVLAVPVANNVAAYAVRLCGGSRPDDPRTASPSATTWPGRGPRARKTWCWRPRPAPC